MSRSRRLGLLTAAILLVVVSGGYTAYWMIAAGRLKDGVVAWAEAMRGQGLDASWKAARVAGYPFAFRLDLSELRLRGEASAGEFDLGAPTISGTTGPFNFRDWSVAAPQGIEANLAQHRVPFAHIEAAAASGAVSVPPETSASGGTRIWLSLDDATAEPAGKPDARGTATAAHLWMILPDQPVRSDAERSLGFAADLRGVRIPAAPAPFTGTIEDFGFGISVMGNVPSAPPRQAAEAWRRSGGTVEFDHFNLDCGGLRIEGSGTLALDSELQPIGAFSGAIEGYDRLFGGLVTAGQMRPAQAGIAQLALGVLAKTGPDGKPRIETSFTIQNGQMYLGPVKLGPAPRIDWR